MQSQKETGAVGRDAASGKPTNSMFFLDRDGGMADKPYDKVHLLIFGEYFPFSDRIPVLMEWFPFTADFGRGPGPGIRRVAGIRVVPQICYEGLFPDFSRSLADQGAQIFVNITNDSWFGTFAEPRQHLVMTLARGIEFRRPVVRATNTGVSAAMRADGTLLDLSPLHTEWTGLYEIPLQERTASHVLSALRVPARAPGSLAGSGDPDRGRDRKRRFDVPTANPAEQGPVAQIPGRRSSLTVIFAFFLNSSMYASISFISLTTRMRIRTLPVRIGGVRK